jgi:nitrate/nitrite-specific signal transduction histidine kinase
MISVFGAYFLINSLMIQRRTLKSIATLQAGAAIIGSGNLDFKLQEKMNDEIGNLSHAFNRMTTDLKAVTSSKTDLEREVTERKRAETEIRASRKFLEIANRHSDLNSLLQEFVTEIKEFINCEAVGIRLLDEYENIPYMAYLGFSRHFYETESPLSIKTDKCMCINVVKRATDPKLPFYTDAGSFYMNGTTDSSPPSRKRTRDRPGMFAIKRAMNPSH